MSFAFTCFKWDSNHDDQFKFLALLRQRRTSNYEGNTCQLLTSVDCWVPFYRSQTSCFSHHSQQIFQVDWCFQNIPSLPRRLRNVLWGRMVAKAEFQRSRRHHQPCRLWYCRPPHWHRSRRLHQPQRPQLGHWPHRPNWLHQPQWPHRTQRPHWSHGPCRPH